METLLPGALWIDPDFLVPKATLLLSALRIVRDILAQQMVILLLKAIQIDSDSLDQGASLLLEVLGTVAEILAQWVML